MRYIPALFYPADVELPRLPHVFGIYSPGLKGVMIKCLLFSYPNCVIVLYFCFGLVRFVDIGIAAIPAPLVLLSCLLLGR